jgi:exosortase/archaeosortase family protein
MNASLQLSRRHPVAWSGVPFPLRFVILGGVGLGIYFALPTSWLEAAGVLLAALTRDLLAAVGVPSVIDGARVLRPGVFGIEVGPECIALQFLVIFAAAVLAYPASTRSRIFAIATATVLYNIFNVLRLASLFILGAISPSLFDLAHSYLWQVAGYILLLGGWLLWLRDIRPAEMTPTTRAHSSGATDHGCHHGCH